MQYVYIYICIVYIEKNIYIYTRCQTASPTTFINSFHAQRTAALSSPSTLLEGAGDVVNGPVIGVNYNDPKRGHPNYRGYKDPKKGYPNHNLTDNRSC